MISTSRSRSFSSERMGVRDEMDRVGVPEENVSRSSLVISAYVGCVHEAQISPSSWHYCGG